MIIEGQKKHIQDLVAKLVAAEIDKSWAGTEPAGTRTEANRNARQARKTLSEYLDTITET